MKMLATVPTSNAQLRKIKKPLIERRRRERINECLTQLKTLVLEAMNRDESCYSKMEKADILEMTVAYLKNLRRHPISSITPVSGASLQEDAQKKKYLMGFSECAKEVGNYLSSMEELAVKVGSPLMKHLISCLENMQRCKVGTTSNDLPHSVDGKPANQEDYSMPFTSSMPETLLQFPGLVPPAAGIAVPVALNLKSYSAVVAFCDGFGTVGQWSSSALLSPASDVTESSSGSISGMTSSPGFHSVDSEQGQGTSRWKTSAFCNDGSTFELYRSSMPVCHSIIPNPNSFSSDSQMSACSQISGCFVSSVAAPFPPTNGTYSVTGNAIKTEVLPSDSVSDGSIWRPW